MALLSRSLSPAWHSYHKLVELSERKIEALKHPKIKVKHLIVAYTKGCVDVKVAVVRHAKFPEKLLVDALSDFDEVCDEALKHPSLKPKHIVGALSNYPHIKDSYYPKRSKKLLKALNRLGALADKHMKYVTRRKKVTFK